MKAVQERSEESLTVEYAPGRVGGPMAWRAEDLQKDRSWIHQLDGDDVRELESAVQYTMDRNIEIIDITRDNFPLEGMAGRIASLRRDITDRIGFGYMRGLPVERYDRERLTRMYFGMSRYIGDPVPQNRNGHLLGHVIDIGTSVNDYNKRITQTAAALEFHSDACDVVGLVCIRTAKLGGESALVSAVAVHDEMFERDEELWRELYQPIVVDRRGEVPAGKQPWMEIPVFHWHKGVFNGYAPLSAYVESARRFEGAPKMSARREEAFRLFIEICNDPIFALRVPFQPGDFQYLQNNIVFHSRTTYEDWPDAERKRHLMRVWLSLPDGRELGPAIAERWINIERGTVRGGVNVPDRKALTIALDPETPAFG